MSDIAVKQLRILLADDHELVRRGLKSLIESVPEWKVCGVAETGPKAVEEARLLLPDIMIVDLNMPGFDGLEVTRRVRRHLPSCEVLIFSGSGESDDLVREVYSSGAKSYISKDEAGQFLIDALRSLGDHKPFFTEKASEIIFARFIHAQSDHAQDKAAGDERLSPDEQELVRLLARGHSNKSVADLRQVSVRTVENMRSGIMLKLKMTSFADLVRYAVRNGLIKP